MNARRRRKCLANDVCEVEYDADCERLPKTGRGMMVPVAMTTMIMPLMFVVITMGFMLFGNAVLICGQSLFSGWYIVGRVV